MFQYSSRSCIGVCQPVLICSVFLIGRIIWIKYFLISIVVGLGSLNLWCSNVSEAFETRVAFLACEFLFECFTFCLLVFSLWLNVSPIHKQTINWIVICPRYLRCLCCALDISNALHCFVRHGMLSSRNVKTHYFMKSKHEEIMKGLNFWEDLQREFWMKGTKQVFNCFIGHGTIFEPVQSTKPSVMNEWETQVPPNKQFIL